MDVTPRKRAQVLALREHTIRGTAIKNTLFRVCCVACMLVVVQIHTTRRQHTGVAYTNTHRIWITSPGMASIRAHQATHYVTTFHVLTISKNPAWLCSTMCISTELFVRLLHLIDAFYKSPVFSHYLTLVHV